MKRNTLILSILSLLLMISCTSQPKQENTANNLAFGVTNLSDEEYPDNPDIGFRSKNYQNQFFKNGEIIEKEAFTFDFVFQTINGDTITVHNFDVSELIPTIPNSVKGDDYLTYISIINQEWNRNQLRFSPDQYSSSFDGIVRLDIARNCLNAYLWEIIIYIEEDGKSTPYTHGWFDFPHELYRQLFEAKNKVSFTKYQTPLENWVDPESKVVDLNKLRSIYQTRYTIITDHSDMMYPVKNARKKKFKEIIFPKSFETMRDLQTDSALFATFTPPGYYNKKDPRKTELGRLHQLMDGLVAQTKKDSSIYSMVHLNFKHKNDSTITSLILGGLDFNSFPVLPIEDANKGWKSSMGIGNHSFYEKYQNHINTQTVSSPYFAVLLDGNGKWLDSHKIGIDGPIFHFEDEERTKLHMWLLSFERHALVGHYVFQLHNEKEYYQP